jgi:ADP-heptose:LPS heptosyltransferase
MDAAIHGTPIYPFERIKLPRSKKAGLLLLSFLAAAIRRLPHPLPRPGHVVILEPYGMGDIISLLPLLAQLEKIGQKTTLLAKAPWLDLADEVPRLDLIAVDLPWSSYSGKAKYRFQTLAGLRATITNLKKSVAGAVGIDPRGDIRSILFLQLIGCSEVLSLDYYLGTDAKVPRWAAQTLPIAQGRRRWEIALDFIKVLGIAPCDQPPPRIHRALVSSASENVVGLICAAPWRGRLWPDDRWRTLIENLVASGRRVVGLCGPGQEKFTSQTLGGIETRSCKSVYDWKRELSRISLLVTLDTGPMHLADAIGIPLVALFGPGQLPMWAPSSSTSCIVHGQGSESCMPVHQVEGNEEKAQLAMQQITVEDVMNRIRLL